MPEPAASTSATVGVPPPSSDFEICTGAPKFGGFSQGAPGVLHLVEQRRHPGQVEQPDAAEADQRVAARSSSGPRTRTSTGSARSASPAPRNRPQLCV